VTTDEAAVSDVVRRILHCDMDCFYAAVHMRDDPSLAGKPVLIGGEPGGRGVVAAASYEARRFGVRSAMPSSVAVRRCPQAIFIRPDFSRYREESSEIFEIFREFTSVVQPVSIDEAYLDVTDQWEPWGSATGVAQEIRRRVKEERRLTVSVGVGPNRLVAKIASDADKPDGLTVVSPSRTLRFLAPLAVRSLPGVGPATETALGELKINTIADLRAVPPEVLRHRFGRYGGALVNYAQGIDERPVRVHRERKSLSAETTFATDLEELAEMDEVIDRLAIRVAGGLERRQLAARTVSVKVRYPDFTTLSRAATLALPTADVEILRRSARSLLRKTEAGKHGVRLLGVATSKLVPAAEEQLSLFQSDEERRSTGGPSAF